MRDWIKVHLIVWPVVVISVTVVIVTGIAYSDKFGERETRERIHLIDACAGAEDIASCIVVGQQR